MVLLRAPGRHKSERVERGLHFSDAEGGTVATGSNISSSPETLSSPELMKELLADAQLLVKRQVLLARLEAEQQLKKGGLAVGLLGSAGGIAFAGLILLLVAAAQAIGMALFGFLWAGGLIMAGALFILAGIVGGIGWLERVRRPVPRTRRTLEKEITWARNQAVT